MKSICFTLLLLLSLNCLMAQIDSGTTIRIDRSYDNLAVEAFIAKLEAAQNLRFFYDPKDLPDFKISMDADTVLLTDLLNPQLDAFDMQLTIGSGGSVFISKETGIQTQLPDNFFTFKGQSDAASNKAPMTTEENQDFLKTSNEFVGKTAVIGSPEAGRHKATAIVSGQLKSNSDGAPVIGATLLVEELGTGTATDASGFYNIELTKGKYTLIINSLSFEEEKYKIEVLSDGRLDLLLEPKLILLKGVTVRSGRFDNVKGTQMGVERLTVKSIKEVPLVMGESDILKVAQLLPGVQSVGEGSAGFNVRGSPADQNMFYINKVPVYNTAHLFGFFSAFNSDAISEFSLSKSNIPVKFGGRLASIFDVTAKQGNRSNFKARGGISPVTGRLMIEGPIQKDKSNFLVAVRSTYSDWILKLINDEDYKNSSARFADGIANLSFELNQNNQIKLFAYHSFDRLNFAQRTQFDYENTGASASWNHLIKDKHSLETSVIYSNYALNVTDQELVREAYKANNDLKHYEANSTLLLRLSNDHHTTLGVSSVLYDIDRGALTPFNSESQIAARTLGKEKGLESAIFLSDEWDITPRIALNGGLRFNLYSYLGPQEVFTYQEEVAKTKDSVKDTLYYGNSEIIKTYQGLDFRIAGKYLFHPDFSVKASFNRLHQFTFLLSNTIALAPTDSWKLSDAHISPMVGDQYSVGLYSNVFRQQYKLSVEGYYKKVSNLVAFKDGADLIANEFPERDVLQGDLKAYGIELMFKKPYGRLNGWLNYTWSRSRVLVNSPVLGENINFGQSFPADYDKPHAVNAVANYKVSRRFSLSCNIVYSTGRPSTFPTTVYDQDGIQLINYSGRNEYRLPDYFRVDLSAKIEGNLLADKLIHSSWAISLYNVTGRKNVYTAFFYSQDGKLVGRKVSIFGTPVFSISYNFKFGNYAD